MRLFLRRRLLTPDGSELSRTAWTLIFAAFGAWVAWRLGAFDLWATVVSGDGTSSRIPNTFATVDHPFHAGRAEALRRSLADGQMLRWIGNHQGGYPVEFYPLGAAWLEVAVWSMLLGSLPMMVIHKLVVIGVFVLPGFGFYALARVDRLPLSIGFLALAAHVSVRGWWWSGGYMELIEWGLLTNVASAAVLPLVTVALFQFIERGDKGLGVLAAVVAAFAMYTNIRSVFPLAAIVVGVLVSRVLWSPDRMVAVRSAIQRSAKVTGLALLLLAPLAMSLARFSDSYVFVRYSGYADLSAYWKSTVQAVSSPVLAFGIVGAMFALFFRRDPMARTVVIVLALYMAGTAAAGAGSVFGSLVSQLEATRLMPFQRLLVMYLAAYGVFALAEVILKRLPSAFWPGRELALIVAALIVVAGYALSWIPGVPDSDQTPTSIVTTADSSIRDLQVAIEIADHEAPPGTAILVLGTVLSWHDQLWAPQWSDRRFFYDDWLWYWQTDHAGDYDPLTSHAYDRDGSTLTQDYLQQHAIGAVVVTGEASPAASGSPLLSLIHSGAYDAYLVNSPQSVISAANGRVNVDVFENQAIEGTALAGASEFLVRHNWFPRWSATVDGEPATIVKDADGYMAVNAPQQGAELALEYRVDRRDWLARVLCALGVIASAAWLVGPNRVRERLPARTADRGRHWGT
ncbi:hypothetical protein BH20CHL4_BH20CHL4_09770 [soil metagenome]